MTGCFGSSLEDLAREQELSDYLQDDCPLIPCRKCPETRKENCYDGVQCVKCGDKYHSGRMKYIADIDDYICDNCLN